MAEKKTLKNLLDDLKNAKSSYESALLVKQISRRVLARIRSKGD